MKSSKRKKKLLNVGNELDELTELAGSEWTVDCGPQQSKSSSGSRRVAQSFGWLRKFVQILLRNCCSKNSHQHIPST